MFDVSKIRNSDEDFYDALIDAIPDAYGYDDIRHMYWDHAIGVVTNVDLFHIYQRDPARAHMERVMTWLQGALKRPQRLVDQLPEAMYGSGLCEDPVALLSRLEDLPTRADGRFWFDALAWLLEEWELAPTESHWVKLGDRCGHATCEPHKGCNECLLYRCYGCAQVRSWSDGGTDTELCDTCWVARHARWDLKTIDHVDQYVRHCSHNCDKATRTEIQRLLSRMRDEIKGL